MARKPIKKNTENRKQKTGRKKRGMPRKLISAAEVKRLAFEYENIVQADETLTTKKSLAEMIKGNKELTAAWERGQFLRNLKDLAGEVNTVSEAAHELKLRSGEELRELLDTDKEIEEIWRQTRFNKKREVRSGISKAATEGNQTAIKACEKFLQDDKQTNIGTADLSRLSQKEICELLGGITRATINDWEKRFQMPRNSDKTYNLPLVLRWYTEYVKNKYVSTASSPDEMRKLKADGLRLDLEERKGQLLKREEVVAGMIARVQLIVGAFQYKKRELANLVHGQTVGRIEEIMGRFFEDLQREQLNVPEFLRLPDKAAEKLQECFLLLATAEGTMGEGTE